MVHALVIGVLFRAVTRDIARQRGTMLLDDSADVSVQYSISLV